MGWEKRGIAPLLKSKYTTTYSIKIVNNIEYQPQYLTFGYSPTPLSILSELSSLCDKQAEML